MLIRELIEKINIFNVKVIFDTKEDFINEIKAGILSPFKFACIEGNDRKKYERRKNKNGYRSSSAAIHIPDLTLDELIDTFQCDGTGSYGQTLQQIGPFLHKNVPTKIIFVCFLFLHEVGHWSRFKEFGFDVQLYTEQDIELYKENHRKMQQVWLDRDERIKRGINCELTVRERERLQKCRDEYRQIPNEKYADNFAFEHLPSVIEALLAIAPLQE